jgi:Uncharacterized conserved protein (DUF2190)
MTNPILTKTYNAGAAVRARRFVTFGASDLAVIEAAAATGAIIGASEQVDAAATDRVDVIMLGIAEVIAGGVVTRGQLVTSDANGAAVAAAPAAGANARIAAVALASAVAGDIIPVLLSPGSLQG